MQALFDGRTVFIIVIIALRPIGYCGYPRPTVQPLAAIATFEGTILDFFCAVWAGFLADPFSVFYGQ
jgi:hypothetical protein